MTAPRKIGVIGGMGPEATVLLMQRIIQAVPATDDSDHIPMIVDNNPQVPSRIDALIHGTGADPGPVIADMARRLQDCGAQALAMPCNTAHHYAPAIRAAVTVPFLDMVGLSASRAAELSPPGGKIGILASPAVRSVGLFDPALAAVGRRACYPENAADMLAAIQDIKRNGASDAARGVLAQAARDLHRQGAACNLVACSEFSLIAGAAADQAPALDTLDVLVAEIVRFAMPDPVDRT
ncbi:aspartate/glutamate racemase family protein [Sedimentitalea sp. HM32M-2]|uniref:aspartate/glutamate racemase family protein n=1 Tax=Sedimentitalea sp. HM32M-2 TaxID=3351566 RepID=UPI003639AA0D